MIIWFFCQAGKLISHNCCLEQEPESLLPRAVIRVPHTSHGGNHHSETPQSIRALITNHRAYGTCTHARTQAVWKAKTGLEHIFSAAAVYSQKPRIQWNHKFECVSLNFASSQQMIPKLSLNRFGPRTLVLVWKEYNRHRRTWKIFSQTKWKQLGILDWQHPGIVETEATTHKPSTHIEYEERFSAHGKHSDQ